MTGTIFHLCLAMGLLVTTHLTMSARPFRTTVIDRNVNLAFMAYTMISLVTLA